MEEFAEKVDVFVYGDAIDRDVLLSDRFDEPETSGED